jgi:thiol-disulfide isomerase/thioredoxin
LTESGEIAEDQKLDSNLSAVDRINGFLKIESWYNHKPADYKGKFVLIEFAASWCSACKRGLKGIEHIHETFPDELVVISVFETDAAANDNFPKAGEGRNIKHCIGIDTQRRCANALGVYGIPHAVLIEPEAGVVVWEGMPHQIGYELTDELLRKFFAIGLKK